MVVRAVGTVVVAVLAIQKTASGQGPLQALVARG
jgi:hypothetical protein